jgi:hypothetical protein
LHQKTYKYTILSFLREKEINFHNIIYAIRRTTYYLKRGALLTLKKFLFIT